MNNLMGRRHFSYVVNVFQEKGESIPESGYNRDMTAIKMSARKFVWKGVPGSTSSVGVVDISDVLPDGPIPNQITLVGNKKTIVFNKSATLRDADGDVVAYEYTDGTGMFKIKLVND